MNKSNATKKIRDLKKANKLVERLAVLMKDALETPVANKKAA